MRGSMKRPFHRFFVLYKRLSHKLRKFSSPVLCLAMTNLQQVRQWCETSLSARPYSGSDCRCIATPPAGRP